MKQIHKLSRAVVALTAAFVIIGAAPAFALSGSGGGGSGSGSGGSGDDSGSQTPPSPPSTSPPSGGGSTTEVHRAQEVRQKAAQKAAELKLKTSENKTETENETENSNHPELHQRGEGILAELRKHEGDKQKTPEEKKKQCESHKQGLTTKFANIGNNAQKVQTRIDGIYTKAQAYQAANSLSPTGYAALISTADAAQAASAASITALKAVTPTIDCNNTSVASDVATFKAAAQDTRSKLQAYKTAVRAVLKALEIPKPAAPATTTPTTTTGGTN